MFATSVACKVTCSLLWNSHSEPDSFLQQRLWAWNTLSWIMLHWLTLIQLGNCMYNWKCSLSYSSQMVRFETSLPYNWDTTCSYVVKITASSRVSCNLQPCVWIILPKESKTVAAGEPHVRLNCPSIHTSTKPISWMNHLNPRNSSFDVDILSDGEASLFMGDHHWPLVKPILVYVGVNV